MKSRKTPPIPQRRPSFGELDLDVGIFERRAVERMDRLVDGLGARTVVAPGEVARAVRRRTGSMALGDGRIDAVTDGVGTVYDCVGSSDSIQTAISVLAPGGTLRLIGMAGHVQLDLTPLWHKELKLAGAYAYGHEHGAGNRRTFDLAFELVQAADLGRLVTATYPLARFADAITHAADAGSRAR